MLLIKIFLLGLEFLSIEIYAIMLWSLCYAVTLVIPKNHSLLVAKVARYFL